MHQLNMLDIINDVSCFKFDKNSLDTIKNKNLWKVIHHMQGTPQTMQINPKYHHVLLDIYDFFEREIANLKKDKYSNKIILDPGIGFGKNLKHNLMILNKISIFHSLGFPILIGTSRKNLLIKFLKILIQKKDLEEHYHQFYFLFLKEFKFLEYIMLRKLNKEF